MWYIISVSITASECALGQAVASSWAFQERKSRLQQLDSIFLFWSYLSAIWLLSPCSRERRPGKRWFCKSLDVRLWPKKLVQSGQTHNCTCFAPRSKTGPWEYEQSTSDAQKKAFIPKHVREYLTNCPLKVREKQCPLMPSKQSLDTPVILSLPVLAWINCISLFPLISKCDVNFKLQLFHLFRYAFQLLHGSPCKFHHGSIYNFSSHKAVVDITLCRKTYTPSLQALHPNFSPDIGGVLWLLFLFATLGGGYVYNFDNAYAYG